METSDHTHKSMDELFAAEELSPEELSELIRVPVDVICSAAFAGDLKAKIVNHDIISINRDDALAWMANR